MRARDPLDQQLEETLCVDIDRDVAVALPVGDAPQIYVRASARELSAGIDLHAAGADSKQGLVEHVRDGDRIVHRCTVPSIPALVMLGIEAVQVSDQPASSTAGGEPVDVRLAQQRPVRDVEPDHRDLQAAREDPTRRLRVGPDVELGSRRHVARADRTAHQNDPCDPRCKLGIACQEKGDVRQRPSRNEGDRFGLR